MYYMDSEESIISHFQSVECDSVYFPVENEDIINVFESIYNIEKWKDWKYSAGKADPPPDFYSDSYLTMMEVMRVDDHSYKNKKGKVVNPTNIHIRDVEKEIMQSGIMDIFPNAELIINAHTDLPTDQDHNYTFYYKNFVRTVEHHKERIDLYKTNHPKHKIIFFVMDESSAYFEAEDINDVEKKREAGECIAGKPHFHFMDKNFLKVFENSKIDYFIWYTPFKLINLNGEILDLPQVCVFDVKKMTKRNITYDAKRMISAEI